MHESYEDMVAELRQLVINEARMVLRREAGPALDEIRDRIGNLQVMKKLYET